MDHMPGQTFRWYGIVFSFVMTMLSQNCVQFLVTISHASGQKVADTLCVLAKHTLSICICCTFHLLLLHALHTTINTPQRFGMNRM